ncbi:alpha/beta fold hydrolase [Actinotalea subterranea]|uniref:alpha/beta fold hydrolase n=1 Tax=Actinotalea subterranea TaxID=2607497 RepID=UPI0011F01627|nr:alpha/beta hydrolase [Actinotalea subterranea]
MTSTSHHGAPTPHATVVDGVVQRFHVAGRGPVCVVHPGGPGADWEYLRMPELERHLTVVYVEPIGTGHSGRLANPRDYRIDTYARHLAQVVRSVADPADPRVHLIGHSFGGFVMAHYALLHPERVAGVVLYATAARLGPELMQRALETLVRRAEQQPSRPDLAALPGALQAMLEATTDEALAQALPSALPLYVGDLPARAEVVEGLVRTMRLAATPLGTPEISPFDVRGSLARMTAPALVLCGELDPVCGPEWGRELHALLPTSTYVEVPEAGHMLHLEAPDLFAGAVLSFLADAGAGPGAGAGPVAGDEVRAADL